MTRDDIIRMAREAGFELDMWHLSLGCEANGTHEELERFAELVADAEREACYSIVYGQCGSDNVAQRTVDAIRARKNELYQMQRQHEGS